MNILTVVGARPQFIKASVVSRAFVDSLLGGREILVHTGQHYDTNMSDVFFDELNIPRPDYNLGIGGGTHAQNTGRMMEKIEEIMLSEKPDWVLVYGDTDSTLAGALAAAKLHIPVAHVEAGLRSFNRRMPEEINRLLTDHVSSVLFAPTSVAHGNLRNEGIADEKIQVVGDVMYDSALYYRQRARKPRWFDSLDISTGDFVLCTIHRAENTDCRENMEGIISGISAVDCPVILPLHPRTRNTMQRMSLKLPSNVIVVDPVGYLEMVWLEVNCRVIATDSGGVQKEAYFHHKPCVTLREETEWVELVEGGVNTITGANAELISTAISSKRKLDFSPAIYGDGSSALKIVGRLLL
ncbi:UDP-N-acetylglucosamine 2-epimerase (non-hydrolyzing) [Pseudomonas sp. CrR25]|nr:UDP-N-acetylglucosamine 2-epimerase (non-hydrolyzing) [Pseudomonas sp. CrR25]